MAQPKSKEQAQSQQPARPQEQTPTRRGGARAGAPAEMRAERWPWRPGSAVRRLFDDFEQLFEDFQRGFFGRSLFEEGLRGPLALAEAPGFAWSPRIEVRETGRELTVTAELPGVDPKDVQIECTDEGLTLRGETREEETREEGGFSRSERYYGSFFRRVSLPPDLDLDKAEASFKNGLLRIRLPKSEAALEKVRRIPIEAEAGDGQAAAGGG